MAVEESPSPREPSAAGPDRICEPYALISGIVSVVAPAETRRASSPAQPAASVASVGKEIELRRHTDTDGDVLTAERVRAALAIGVRLSGDYDVAVSTGAQRATQTLVCFLAALAQQVPGGVVVEPGLRSEVEDRWRSAYQVARSGALPALRDADRELVAEDSERLGAALRRVLDNLPDGGRALVVASGGGYSIEPLE